MFHTNNTILFTLCLLVVATFNACTLEDSGKDVADFKISIPIRFVKTKSVANSLHPETKGEGEHIDNHIRGLRAMCFNSVYLDRQTTNFTTTSNQQSYETKMTVPVGEKKIAILANEPPQLIDYLNRVFETEQLKELNVPNVHANANQYGLPMACVKSVSISKNTSTQLNMEMKRSVAKIQLFINKSQEIANLGYRVFITAGSQYTLTNAITNTSFVDRTSGTPERGDISILFPQEVEIPVKPDGVLGTIVYEAYIGDHQNADVSNLNLNICWETREADGITLVERREHTLNYGKYAATGENVHIHRNFIYQIIANVAGNIEASVINWSTMEIVDYVIIGFNTGAIIIPWNTIDYETIITVDNENNTGTGGTTDSPVDDWDEEKSNTELEGV